MNSNHCGSSPLIHTHLNLFGYCAPTPNNHFGLAEGHVCRTDIPMFDTAWPLPPFGEQGKIAAQDWQKAIKTSNVALFDRDLGKQAHAVRSFGA
jgi:hypothetical protein